MGTTATRLSALILAAGILTAGCSSGDNSAEKEDCVGEIENLEVWTKKCVPSLAPTFTMPTGFSAPSTTSSPSPTATTSAPPKPPVDAAIGQPVATVGDAEPRGSAPGGGPLELTVTAVVYRQMAGMNMVTIGIKQRPTGTVAAGKNDAYGFAWEHISPDGKVQEGSSSYEMGWSGGDDPVQPGQYTLDTKSFLIDLNQKGGTVAYKDGSGQVFRWKLPAQDGGPQVAELKKAINPLGT